MPACTLFGVPCQIVREDDGAIMGQTEFGAYMLGRVSAAASQEAAIAALCEVEELQIA
jgi:hypothetical protein